MLRRASISPSIIRARLSIVTIYIFLRSTAKKTFPFFRAFFSFFFIFSFRTEEKKKEKVDDQETCALLRCGPEGARAPSLLLRRLWCVRGRWRRRFRGKPFHETFTAPPKALPDDDPLFSIYILHSFRLIYWPFAASL